MHITVTAWKPREVSTIGGGTRAIEPDRSYVGDVMVVRDVKLPFVLVTKPNDSWKFTLDTRELELMELPKNWANTKKAITQ